MSAEEKKTEKNIPSFLERLVEQICYKSFGKIVPKWVTPNMMTLFGAIGGLVGIVCAGLSYFNDLFLIGTCFGLVAHVVCDDLDGYIARERGLASSAGAYFDLLTDILHITFLLIAMSFAGVISIYIAIFMVPVYALIIFTSMNEIHYLGKFTFPATGPIETHLYFMAICILTMIFGKEPFFTIKGFGFNIGNIIACIGGVVMYEEMIRLQIRVFVGLKRKDNER